MLAQKIILFVIISLLFSTSTIVGQVVYTQSFTDKMEQRGLTWNKPSEDFLKVFPLDRDRFFDYDLVLRSDDGDAEIRVLSYDPDANLMPNVEMMARLTTFATNADTADLFIYSLSEHLKHFYNATWVVEAEFVPKEELTHYTKGTMIALYREEYGLILNTIFHDTGKNINAYRLLFSFKNEN